MFQTLCLLFSRFEATVPPFGALLDLYFLSIFQSQLLPVVLMPVRKCLLRNVPIIHEFPKLSTSILVSLSMSILTTTQFSLFHFLALMQDWREKPWGRKGWITEGRLIKQIWENPFGKNVFFSQRFSRIRKKKQFFIGKDLIFSEPKEVLGFMQTYLSYGLFLSLTCKYSQGSFLKKINDLFLKIQGVLSTVSPQKI